MIDRQDTTTPDNGATSQRPGWFSRIRSLLAMQPMSEEQFRAEQERILSMTPVPVFWLFGKTGSGKTSVVRYLTGRTDAEIGTGFKPQTTHSQEYDFPSPENPVMKFLDTRGLGESRYDPAEDIRQFNESTHVVVVTARVMDHALSEVVTPLREIRRAKPERPVVLALTCLHQAYPQQQHPKPDPFEKGTVPDDIADNLHRSLQRQVERFEGLADHVVPIDFTRLEEGFEQPYFGGERLKATLLETLPAAYRQTLMSLEAAMKPLRDLNEKRAMPYIIGYSTMAASAAAVPVPWVDIPAVMAIQSHLVYQLAAVYGQQLKPDVLGQMAGAAGGRILGRMALRGAMKFIPFVGMAANAALAFAYTYAQGKLCCWYFGQIKEGNAPTKQDVERVWKQQLAAASELWQKTHAEETAP